MSDQSKSLEDEILTGSRNSTLSRASAAGLLPSNSQAGPSIEKSGPAPAPASLSHRPAKGKASKTKGTYGPSSSGSSASAALQRFLGSRLAQRLESVGLMEYKQTWKVKATPAGRSLWAHTASARPTSDKEFTGWPTACAKEQLESSEKKIARGAHAGLNLAVAVQFAGYPTPNVPNGGRQPAGGMSPTGKTLDGKKRQVGTEQIAMLAGWTTALSTDHQRGRMTDEAMERERPGAGAGLSLDARLAGWPTTTTRDSKTDGKDAPNRTGAPSLPGLITELFLVPTGRRVVLAPEFSLWLMGFPEAWALLAPGAKDWQEAQAALELECSREAEMQSSPDSPPSS